MKLYQYPKCSTCRKAVKFLEQHEVAFTSIDISNKPPSKSELKTMLKNYEGNIRKLFNTSGMQYRELNLKDRLPAMSDAEAIDLLAGNGMLVKRPFLLTKDKQGMVGFNEAAWSELL